MQAPKLFILLIACTLSACGAFGPSQGQVQQEVDQAASQQVPELPEQWEEAADSGTVQAGWIDTFSDPVLTALVIEAQENNRGLASTAANVDQAWALARQAGAALTPDVGVSAGRMQVGSSGDAIPAIGMGTLGTQVSWEIDVWGRLASGQRSAIASAQAAEADLRSAQDSLAAATAKAYFSAIEANIQVGIARATVGILEETLRIVSVKYDNQMVSGQDMSLARADLATARERQTAVESSYRDAVRALEVLIGRYPGASLEVRETLPDLPPPPPAGLPSELLERRPDIVAAERRVAAAFNATNQAKAAQLPAMSLTGNLGSSSGSLSGLLDPGNSAWMAGVNLMAPIFDGGALRANVDIQTAQQEQALAAYGEAALNAFQELETNLDQGVVIQQRIDDLQEASTEADNATRIASVRYEEGEEDLLNLLTIQRRSINSRSSLSSAERLLLEQRVNLNLALGGGW